MKEIAFDQFNIQPDIEVAEIKCCDETIEVCSYLPINEKTKMLQFIVNGALDDTTGTFSPLRVEVYFAIAVCRWYGGITFTKENLQNVAAVYDTLETNGVTDSVIRAIPESEMSFMRGLVEETIQDIERYNTSAAGIIQSMGNNASGLEGEISKILEQIKNSEGLEQLSVIKDMVGKD